MGKWARQSSVRRSTIVGGLENRADERADKIRRGTSHHAGNRRSTRPTTVIRKVSRREVGISTRLQLLPGHSHLSNIRTCRKPSPGTAHRVNKHDCISYRYSTLELGGEDSPVVDSLVEQSPSSGETAEVQSAPDPRLALCAKLVHLGRLHEVNEGPCRMGRTRFNSDVGDAVCDSDEEVCSGQLVDGVYRDVGGVGGDLVRSSALTVEYLTPRLGFSTYETSGKEWHVTETFSEADPY